jgi:hypothetical protein
MHLTFVGFIVAPLAAVPLGMTLMSTLILWYCLAAALVIWALASARSSRARRPAAPPAAGDPPRAGRADSAAAAHLLGLAPLGRARGARHVPLRRPRPARALADRGRVLGLLVGLHLPDWRPIAGVLFLNGDSRGAHLRRRASGSGRIERAAVHRRHAHLGHAPDRG